MNYVIHNGELYHHGVKGMKWGVRRFQNPDGSLTPAGKKRVTKEYEKSNAKVNRKLHKRYNSMRVKAYNKAADDMNNGEIEKFNSEQRKKYGDKYAERDGYIKDYNEMFGKRIAKYMDTSLNDFYTNDKDFRKCEELVKKYNMTDWNELAMKNTAVINDLRRTIKSGNHG